MQGDKISYADLNSMVIQLQSKMKEDDNWRDSFEYHQVVQPFYGVNDGTSLLDKIEHKHWNASRDSTKLTHYFWKKLDQAIENYDPDITNFNSFASSILWKTVDFIKPKQTDSEIGELPTVTLIDLQDDTYLPKDFKPDIDYEDIELRINQSLSVIKQKDIDRALYFWKYLVKLVNVEIYMETDGDTHNVKMDEDIIFSTLEEAEAHKELYKRIRAHRKVNQLSVAREMEDAGFGKWESNKKFLQRYMKKCQLIFYDIKPNTNYNKRRRKRLNQRSTLVQNQWEKDHAEKYSSSFFDRLAAEKNKERKQKYNEFTKEQPVVSYSFDEFE